MNSTQKRLLKEYKTIQKELKDPSSSIRKSGIQRLLPLEQSYQNENESEDDLFKWEATILGIEGTPFADTLFDLIIEIPLNYPIEPPTIFFKTLNDNKINALQQNQNQKKLKIQLDSNSGSSSKRILKKCFKIPHPNVSFADGKICLDILQDKWTPAWTLTSAVMAIIVLLNDPEPLSPLNIDLANLLKIGDKIAYDQCIKYYIEKWSILQEI